MKPHRIFGHNIEGGALDQFYSAMKEPFVIKGALMPDAHLGYSLPIGGVVATSGVILPSYVGYDIGCGVASVKTNIKVDEIAGKEQAIYDSIMNAIPVGGSKHKRGASYSLDGLTPEGQKIFLDRHGFHQLGTLGGGNHFIEIGSGPDGFISITVHSGSRGAGHGVAGHYMCKAAGVSNPNKAEGHHPFDLGSDLGKSYVQDMNFMLEYALRNRKLMCSAVGNVISDIIDKQVNSERFINRNHNHAELMPDVLDGGYIVVHRKGATHAEKGMMGVIPGNMKDGVFITTGLGCEDSLYSSSHGAGRVSSRGTARRACDIDVFKKSMEGIVMNRAEHVMDENPLAYKDIHEVLRCQVDAGILKINEHIKPLINIKG